MKIKNGFTLAEVLVCLSVIAVMYAIMIPILAKNSPKEQKVLLRKSYNTIEKVVYSMINDDKIYPDIDLGFAKSAATVDSAAAGADKFCYYFIDAINTVSEDFSTCSAKTSDGVAWKIENIKFNNANGTVYTGYSTKITADVNGDREPNCEYNSVSCTEPDKFHVLVRYDGKIQLSDTYMSNLLQSPTENK